MAEPRVHAPSDEDVVLFLAPGGYVVEALARLRHGHAAYRLAHNHHDQSQTNGVCIAPEILKAREVVGGDEYLYGGCEVGGRIGEAVGEEQVARDLCIVRVPAGGRVELEKVEQGQCRDELRESPDALAGQHEVDGSQCAARQRHAQEQSL